MIEYSFEVKNLFSNTTYIEQDAVPEGEDPTKHFNKLIESWNNDFPNDRRELIRVIGQTGVKFCDFYKVNNWTVSRGNEIYDLMACKNCFMVFQRFGVGQTFNYKTVCRPHLVCKKCNKVFVNSAGLNAHNKRGKHKLPNWYPDGV